METLEPRFIADVHLGKLARRLRLLGFDTLYQNNFTRQDLICLAVEEGRMLLSRDLAFGANRTIHFMHIDDENPTVQLTSLIKRLKLKNRIRPFSRCLACNGMLQEADKEKIALLIEDNTSKYFDRFWQCENCRRIYWKGSHYDHMLELVAMIEKMADDPPAI